MTILHPKRFQQAKPAGYDGEFDWDFLLPAFKGTNIKPMDWDGVVEKNHRFLVFETKELGKEIPIGQEICLQRAVRTGRFTVVIVYGKNETDIDGFEVWSCQKSGDVARKRFDGGSTELLLWVGVWFQQTSGLFARNTDTRKLTFNTCQACGQHVNGLEIS